MTLSSKPKAVIFDWDNTLANNWGSIAESINAVQRAFGREIWSYEQVQERCKLALRDSFPLWYGDQWQRAREIFYAHFGKVHLSHLNKMPGADVLLGNLQFDQIPLFIVSNKHGDSLRREVVSVGWRDIFVSIIGSMDAAEDKPSRLPIDLALSKAGIVADDEAIWMVGDTEIDMQAGRAAGCTPVFMGAAAEAKQQKIELYFPNLEALNDYLYD